MGGWKNIPDRLIEHGLETSLRKGAALEVFDGTNLPPDLNGLLVGDGRRLHLTEVFPGRLVVTEIELRADEDLGHARGVM